MFPSTLFCSLFYLLPLLSPPSSISPLFYLLLLFSPLFSSFLHPRPPQCVHVSFRRPSREFRRHLHRRQHAKRGRGEEKGQVQPRSVKSGPHVPHPHPPHHHGLRPSTGGASVSAHHHHHHQFVGRGGGVFVQWCHLLHVVVVHRRGGVGRVGHSHEEACLSAAGELSAGGG